MRSVALLTGRNLKLYLRDRMGVFFSLLSSLILIVIYAMFLGKLQMDTLGDRLPQASDRDIQWFVSSWVLAGTTMITTLTTALASLSVFVDDNVTGRFKDFIVSPLRRTQLIFGYMISSFVISVGMTTIIFIVGQIYLVILFGEPMSVGQVAKTFGFILLSSAVYAALSSFVATYMNTSGAFSALSTIVGTIVGFLAGAYIPAGNLPEGVVNVMNALPFAQSAMLFRGPFTQASLDAVAGGQAEAVETLEEFYGISSFIGDFEVTGAFAVACMVAVFAVFVALGILRLTRKIQ